MSEKNMNTEGKKYIVGDIAHVNYEGGIIIVTITAYGDTTIEGRDLLGKFYLFTPDMIVEPFPTPTAQWQKEAERYRHTLFPNPDKYDRRYTSQDCADWIEQTYTELSALRHAEHNAHMEQVQREVDEIVARLNNVEGLQNTDDAILIECISRLRRITKTKTDKG